MRLLSVILAALGSAAFFSLATALKHRSAGLVPHLERFRPRAIGDFALATLRHPLWLAGIGADVGGLALQVFALHRGALSVVQPLLVTAVLFSLVVAHRIAGTRVSRREVWLGLLLVAAVAGFLAFSGAIGVHEGRPYRASTLIAAATIVVLVVAAVAVSRRLRRTGHGRVGAALLGAATGLIYACTAALIKSCTHVLVSQGVVALLSSWQPYVLAVAGGLGLVLAQLAFQSGPLASSLPATASVDPVASIALAIAVFHERLHADVLSVSLSVLALAAMATSVALLTLVRTHVSPSPAADPLSPAARHT